MNLKRIAVFALLLITAASAHAQLGPKCNVNYRCHYTNYTGPIVQDGLSMFINCPAPGSWGWLNRITEKFQSKFNGQVIWDNRVVVFAKPYTHSVPDAQSVSVPIPRHGETQWEFTAGSQCKNTVVVSNDDTIAYGDCTDGSSRTCYPVP